MKKLAIVFGLVLLIFSFVIVSASNHKDLNSDGKISFGEWLKQLFGKITGKQISSCFDSDGMNIFNQGNCADGIGGYIDDCISSTTIKEYICGKVSCTYQSIGCGAGYACSNGKCVYQSQGGELPDGGESPSICPDSDHDGFFVSTRGCASPYDCNDTNSLIKPGAAEICGNNVDEDCSGADLVCGAPTCVSNWTKIETACQIDETFTTSYLNKTACIDLRPQNETSNCDYNKNNLICESFSEINSVGIGGYLLNISKNYTGTQLVQLAQEGDGGVDFKWNFTNPLNFCNISVEVADSSVDNLGYTIVKNVGVSNKTLWVERLNNSNKVCVKDIPGEISIDDFSKNCNNDDEVLVLCPSEENSTYNCEIVYDETGNFSWFQVWPLNHSAVKEMLGLITAAYTGCNENWNCTNWSDAFGQCGQRICKDLNNCTTSLNKPIEISSCVVQGIECIPNWDCTDFGKCADGIKSRTCEDLGGCGDDTTKPNETLECKKKISPLIIILIIVGLALIIFLIWYFMKKKKDEEEFSKEPKAETAHPKPPVSPQTNVYIP